MLAQPTTEQLVAKIRALKPQLELRYHVRSLALFGSYARHKQAPGSDLDVLVSFQQAPSLLTFVELEDFLSDSLDVKVDLVMEEALKPSIGRHIREQLVPV